MSNTPTLRLAPYSKSEARRLALLLMLFVLLSGFYSFVTPLFEAPDEKAHLQFISWLAQENSLPNIQTDLANVSHEIGQPPLYYGMLAPILAQFDLSDLDTVAPVNRNWQTGAGINAHFHTEAELFPYQGTALAVHLLRLFSVILGSITVAATYALARMVSPPVAFTAALLVALNPQFLFMSGVINNDNLVTALSALTLLLLLKLIRDPEPSRWQYLLLGCVWGLAILSKLTGVGLGGVIAVGLMISAWRRQQWRPLLLGGGLVGTAMLAVSGWWFWRNWVLYGDPLAWDTFLLANANLLRAVPISWGEAIRASLFFSKSFWATFNYGVLAPNLFYRFVNGLMLLAAAGFVRWLWLENRRQFRQTYLLIPLLAWLGLVYVALLRWMRLVGQTEQGRLLFPAIFSLALLLAIGLHAFNKRWIPVTAVTILGVWASILPLFTIQEAFAAPPQLAEDFAMPSPQKVLFGEEIALVGYDVMPAANPGEPFEAKLFWEGQQTMQENYVVALRLLDLDGKLIAGLDTIPYENRYPTPSWAIGRPFQDTYSLLIPETADAGLATLSVTLYPWRQTEDPLPVWVDGQLIGESVNLTAIKIRNTAPSKLEPQNNVQLDFGHQLQLFGYDAPAQVTAEPFEVTLYWQAVEPDGQDYTIFMHLVDSQGNVVAQADSPPQNGRFPTSILESGEQITDTHLFHLPEGLAGGRYQILMGVYHPETGVRLPAINNNNEQLIDDTLHLHTVIIIP